MNDNLQKLTTLLDLVDTKSNIEEFVTAFTAATEYLAKNQDQMGQDLAAIITRLNEMASKLELDNKDDLNRIKGLVADAIRGLQAKVDAEVSTRLANIKDGKDGKDGISGKDGKDGKIGRDGKDGSPDTPDQVVDKVNISKKQIKSEKIEGLTDLKRQTEANMNAMPITTMFVNGMRGKNLQFNNAISKGGDTINISIPIQPNAPANPTLGMLWIDNS
jgi:hypothetical protein